MKQLIIEKQKLEDFLKNVDKRSEWAKAAKKRLDAVEFAIWKKNNPESYENHREVLKGFVESGCFGSL